MESSLSSSFIQSTMGLNAELRNWGTIKQDNQVTNRIKTIKQDSPATNKTVQHGMVVQVAMFRDEVARVRISIVSMSQRLIATF